MSHPFPDALELPATSQCQVNLNHTAYDITQLLPALEAALDAPVVDPAPVTEDFCHVHTLIIPALLRPPPAYHQLLRRGSNDNVRINADRTSFDSAVSILQTQREAGVPVTLSPPTEDCIHQPLNFLKVSKTMRLEALKRSPNVFLPGAHKAFVNLPAVHAYAGRAFLVHATTWDSVHWLHAALALDPNENPTRTGNYRDQVKRIQLRTGVQVVWFPGTTDDSQAELRLIITIEAYLNMSHIAGPCLPDVGAGLFGLFLATALPADVDTGSGDTVASWLAARAAALKKFYECLKPAPELPFSFDARKLQPAELACKLLPFQARTVRLLLEREGAPICASVTPRQPRGQWSLIRFDGFGDYAFHRLTAQLQPITLDRKGKAKEGDASLDLLEGLPCLFSLSSVRGTMLCEEMGLGKTVEAIALMVLHRHPLSSPHPPITTRATVKSQQIDLQNPPDVYNNPQVREWLDKEHLAFADAVSWSEEAQLNVAEVAATLVVTPLSLLQQWVNEINNHAPNLRICIYPGWKALLAQLRAKRSVIAKTQLKREAENRKRKAKDLRNTARLKYAKGSGNQRIEVEMESSDETQAEEDGEPISLLSLTQLAFLDYVRGHDVVVTTYQALIEDLGVANPVPARSRRSTAKYNLQERPRSPLVMCKWWRVIMDEVQLHGDQTAASNMVSLIPRNLSLAMSGTPARSDIKDLLGSLRFLGVPFGDGNMWHRLLQPANASALHGLFQAISVRTMKAEVAGEFNLPLQKRYVIPIQLSDIEMHYYLDTLERQRERLRSQMGGFTPSLFGLALRHLRQICTHIQVGALQRGGLGNILDRGGRMHLGSRLMTMEEALKKMNDDHQAEVVSETRSLMRFKLKKGQLFLLNDGDYMRQLRAIGQYEEVREMSKPLLESARARLAEVIGDRDDNVDDEEDASRMTQHERERAKEILSLRATIRETLLLVHHAWFLEGDAHHQMADEDKEVAAYEAAEAIRKDILRRPLQITEGSINMLEKAFEQHPAYTNARDLCATETKRAGGILSADVIEQSNSLLKILNDNALLVHSWREKLYELLTGPVEAVDEEVPLPGHGQNVENPEEEYYAKALQAQGEIEAYLTAYAAVIADRKEMLLEDRTILATVESRITKKRVTKNSKEAAADAQAVDLNTVDDQTLNLMLERQAFRDRRKQEGCERPLKAMLIDLSNIEHSAQRREEVAIAESAAAYLRRYIKAQTEVVNKLNKELETIRATFNRRASYFAALQEISDSVASEDSTIFRQAYRNVDRMIFESNERLMTLRVRSRFLQSLSGDDSGGGANPARDMHEECVVCFGTSDDKHAILLACGHAFCVSCYKEYRKAGVMGTRCATCKVRIDEREATRVRIQKRTEGSAEPSGSQEGSSAEAEGEDDEDIYGGADGAAAAAEQESRRLALDKINFMSPARQRDIHALDSMGEYGSKIDFLVKHLLWYKLMRPGVRHVVFSNWADSLHIVEQAFRANSIKYVSLDANTKKNSVVEKFQADKSIMVFLLHAERESAGLTLTSCGVVHLLEPVLQHSFELQAIGRVDRLGQEAETRVYCYATLDTVEARILAQGVRNGTSIYLADKKEDEAAMAAMENVAHAASHGGDVAAVSSAVDEELLKLIF
ncbi:hypothetical protein CC85DRAFT_282178 [Cutaneotrichosporon oleaginosum]|uniref:RING-type domain-containing protein n=1 Tax=Cutaneotrichosporon oleaginosum TaxID=879819 RepID=A0A0J0XYC5_9TREE|nr:uncharacterized protein CC85DRAFT_282178 [Cutaneotrichosporon oleaginosum]KLT46041.1 hypothetical protein CC85DRAFT_282178 [Cutaneotrichosporon oleaginosum]TXT06735.1 hypothetical protein COLE_06066 [Cutaneotrichosporon oleaginosum]